MKKAKASAKHHGLREFCRGLRKYDNFLLSCHVGPEGDAIGSLLAMDSLLRRIGKKTTIVCEDPFPKRLHCLPSKGWHSLADRRRRRGDFEALLVTDSPSLARIGRVPRLLGPSTVIFNVDHHISNTRFGHFNYVKPEAAATGEVVFDVFKRMRLRVTKHEATYLYIAMSSDTGAFHFGNTTAETHRVTAHLMAAGIPVERINEELYANYSLSKIHLYSRLFGRIKTAARGRIAWVGMKRSDLTHSGATEEDTEGFVDFLNRLREVQVSFFLTELARAGRVRVSFRCKRAYDVNRIASHFRGGGHRKAAGCVIEAPLAKAERLVLNRVRREFHLS